MMRNTELKPGIWIAALLRRAQVAGAFATLIRKGDPDGGAALLLVRGRQGKLTLYRAVRNMQGQRVWWSQGPLSDADANAYIFGRVDNDPDIWVVEIEDAEGRHFLTDPVVTEP